MAESLLDLPSPVFRKSTWPSSLLTVKILFLSLLLVLLPLSLIFTLPFSIIFSDGIFYPSALRSHPFFLHHNRRDALFSPLLNFLHRRYFNQTLLDMAKMDLAEPEELLQIKKILNGPLQNKNRYSNRLDRFGSSSRVGYRRRSRYYRSREHEKLPVQLSTLRYQPYWPEFRRIIQDWTSKKRHEPQVMKELLHLVKDPIDQHYMKGKNISHFAAKPYQSCAVVGNSGILLNQSYGALIDSHDMVMRLNNARIKGFEHHVGHKTTLSFVNSNILHTCERRPNCFCHPYGQDVPLIMYICQVVHFMDVAVCSSKLQAPIVVTDARFDTLCTRIVKYYSLKRFSDTTPMHKLSDWSNSHEGMFFHYSSGMQAVLLAAGICEEVSIFGFGKTPNAKHHYHTSQKEELHLHDYLAEYQFYKDLATGNPRLVPFLNEAGFSIPPVNIYWS